MCVNCGFCRNLTSLVTEISITHTEIHHLQNLMERLVEMNLLRKRDWQD